MINKRIIGAAFALLLSIASGYAQPALVGASTYRAAPVAGLGFALGQGAVSIVSGGTGYAGGDTVTLACGAATFTTNPVVGISSASGGVVTGISLIVPGVATAAPSSCVLTQSSTTGTGTGLTVGGNFGLIAAYLSMPSLSTGGSATNGNLYLNNSFSDGIAAVTITGGENTFLGNKAGTGLAGNSSFNFAGGHNALGNGGAGTSQGSNTGIGTDAGRNIQGASTTLNTLVGSGAGRNVASGWNTFVGAAAGGSSGTNSAGLVTGFNNVGLGFNALAALTSGAGNLCLGTKACSGLTSGARNIILVATDGSDTCANGNESNVFVVCAGAGGRLIASTGANTPATAITTIAGNMLMPNLPASAGAGGLFACVDNTGKFYIKATCP